MIRHTITSGVIAIAALLTVLPASAQAAENVLQNAGFESELSPEVGDWVLFDGSRLSTDHARSGSRSVFNWGISRNRPAPPYLTGRASGSYQEFFAAPGSTWRLTGFGMTANRIRGYPAFGILQISFFDAEGKDLGTVETEDNRTTRAKISNEVNRNAEPGEWVALDTGVATAPAGTATVQAFTLFVDYSAAAILQGVYFDDLSLCETNESGDCIASQSR